MAINPKIEKLAKRFKISPRKLSALQKAGFLNLESDPRIMAIKRHYAMDRGASAVHLVWLLREPKLLKQIGTYEAQAKADIEALGDWQGARSAIGWLSGAARGEKAALNYIEQWAKEHIPAHDVGHNFLTVRLLKDVHIDLLDQRGKEARYALLKLRKRESFAGWWRIERPKNRPITIYRKPIA